MAEQKLAEAIAFEEKHPVAPAGESSRKSDLVKRKVDRLLDEAVELEAPAFTEDEQFCRVA
jgi:hypothetical protein